MALERARQPLRIGFGRSTRLNIEITGRHSRWLLACSERWKVTAGISRVQTC